MLSHGIKCLRWIDLQAVARHQCDRQRKFVKDSFLSEVSQVNCTRPLHVNIQDTRGKVALSNEHHNEFHQLVIRTIEMPQVVCDDL
jgi:hypothetical protein